MIADYQVMQWVNWFCFISKSPRWMKIVLILSLMLNVLVIGAVGARAWMIHRHGHDGAAMHALGVHSFLRKLPRERRKELRQKFGKMRGELRRHRATLIAPMKTMADALAAPELDKAKLEGALRTLRETHESRATARERYLLDLVASLSAEERQMLGRKIAKRLERRERWHKKFKKWRED